MSALQKRPENELMELLWRNGHMPFNNLTVPPTIFESKQTQKPESLLKCGGFLVNSSSFSEDEATSWSQEILNNSVNKELSDFFCGIPTSVPDHTDKRVAEDTNACAKHSSFHPQENVAYPSNSDMHDGNTSMFSKPGITDSGIVGEEASDCRKRTIPSSTCGNTTEANNSELGSMQDCFPANINEPVIASSSGVSSFSFVRTAQQITTNHGYKRKERDTGISEVHNEEAEFDSAEKSQRAQKLESGHKNRAAAVHNLSERRRRDRINEKLRELQDLIPHSSKIDKVSVLDEAIEYLKSLQLQLQYMWMRNGMAPMLFPSIRRHFSCMSIGMNHHMMTSTRGPIQPPKAPPNDASMSGTSIQNQAPVFPLQDPNSINFATQMQNFYLQEQISSHPGFPQM